ncbi:MAG: S8 family serine peptidase [Achromobacter sp.]|uniref:S8 family peptidase n=1 Tax=Achromobacter sp. TaxID=134375 RepID=UPI0029AA9238|nr:S8 family serine peptidase [Achromobacter sp.]MDX3988853.1 S8 family serine peptidase [Achromobacter sp.]
MKNKIPFSMLVLALGTAFSAPGHAASADEPRPIYVRLKAEAPNPAQRTAPTPEVAGAMDALTRLTPGMEPLIPMSPMMRNYEDIAALERHNLTRYYKISAEMMRGRDAELLVKQLLENPLVESAQIEPVPMSIGDGLQADPAMAITRAAPGTPDYTKCDGAMAPTCQNYMQSPKPGYWPLGGVNAFEAQRLTGHYGANVRLISNEINHWDFDHVDLPKPFLHHGQYVEKPDSHDTMSAGIMFGQDNGYGVTGIVPQAQAGYTKYSPSGMVDLRNVLQAGDVVQIGVHYKFSNGCGPTTACWLPVEHVDVVYDAISYLTKEKGVHVVLAAANGAANLDDPWFRGRYDRTKRDSGAIYVGAADPVQGQVAWFSETGSRVDMFSWGGRVTTTDWKEGQHNLYTTAYSGTSSANPIIAGSVAWLQSLARERGLGNIPPKVMRQILVDSGNPVPIVNPARPIGVQPDLVRAAELLGGDSVGGQAPQAHVVGSAQANAGDKVVLSAADSTGKGLNYAWSSQPALTFIEQGVKGSFVAPENAKDVAYRITLKVTDSQGRSASTHHGVLVKAKAAGVCANAPAWDARKVYNVPNEAVSYNGKVYHQNYWNVDAAPDKNSAQYGKPWKMPESCDLEPTPIPLPVARISGPAEVAALQPATLSASGSTGQGLKYVWTSLDEIGLQANGATVTFYGPPLAQDRNLTFKLAVTDERGRTATATHVVKAKAKVVVPEVIAPQAKLSGPATVKGGERVVLSGKASTGTDLRYRWTVPAGISAGALDQADISFVAPTSTKDTPYRFTLTVSNSRGEVQASHTVTVQAQAAVGGHPQYKAGTIYKAGDKVMNVGKTFECKIFPYSGWCSQSPSHYAPGTGSHWRDAWMQR